MGVDLATGGGIAQGLMQGLQMYLQTQNMLEEQAIKKKLANAQSIDAASKLYDSMIPPAQATKMLQAYGLPTMEDSPQQGGGMLASQQQAQPNPSSQAPRPQGLMMTNADPTAAPGAQPQPSSPVAQAPSQPGGMLGGYDVSNLPYKQRVALQMPILQKQMELQTPQGQVEQQKRVVDLQNSQMQQYNEGAGKFDPQKKTFEIAADAYGKLVKVTNDNSPKNLQSALMQVIKLDMPQQAVRYNTIQAMEDDPQINERWGNYFSKLKSGVPSDLSIQDIKRLGTNLYQSNSDQFRAAQKDEINNAKRRGVDNPTYVSSSYADKMDQLANQTKQSVGKYQAPGPGAVVDQMAPPQVAGFIKKAGSGLYAGAKGLINNLTPGQSMAENQDVPTGPPPGLSFEQFKKWKKSNGKR